LSFDAPYLFSESRLDGIEVSDNMIRLHDADALHLSTLRFLRRGFGGQGRLSTLLFVDSGSGSGMTDVVDALALNKLKEIFFI